ncbi:MAG: RDD family protein [Thermaerobacter sp.]|nr:RDD family protein [Thermaerobacter sp.]
MRAAGFRERTVAYLLDVLVVGAIGWALSLPLAIWALLLFAYTALSLWAFSGRTPGKILLRLQVVGKGSKELSPYQYILRPLVSLLELTLLCGGFVFALFTRERLALHDLILGTRVVKQSSPRRRTAPRRARTRAKRRRR